MTSTEVKDVPGSIPKGGDSAGDGESAGDGDGDTDFYSHDAIVVFTPYLGGGVSLLQNKVVCLGINASAGYRLISNTTYHDLEMVSFKNAVEYKVNFELTFSFE